MTQRSSGFYTWTGLLVLVLLAGGLASTVLAASSPRSSTSDAKTAHPKEYDKGMKLVLAGDYAKARRAFERAARNAPDDADVLNMLAYSQRKSGELDRAMETYKKALEIRPRFPQAREYLAEAYLQASLRELKTLESYGSEAEEEHAELVHALQSAASDLTPPAEASRKPSW